MAIVQLVKNVMMVPEMPIIYGCPEGKCDASLRADLPFPIDVPVMPRIPRISLDDLYLPENADFAAGERPFIATETFYGDWRAARNWTAQYFKDAYLREVVDFYPENMLEMQGQQNLLATSIAA